MLLLLGRGYNLGGVQAPPPKKGVQLGGGTPSSSQEGGMIDWGGDISV